MTSQAELAEVRDRVRARYARAAHTVAAGASPLVLMTAQPPTRPAPEGICTPRLSRPKCLRTR